MPDVKFITKIGVEKTIVQLSIKMKYYVAYKNHSGEDFHGTPWIHPEGGVEKLNEAKELKNSMKEQHLTNLVLFGCNKIPETVTWNYVDSHKISD